MGTERTSIEIVRRMLFVWTFVLCSVGCAPVYIAPSTHSMPVTERGALTAAAYAGSHGVDGRVAYAPADDVVIHGVYSRDGEGDNTHDYAEVGGGFARGDRARFSVLAGVGYGRSQGEARLESTTWSGQGTYLRGFAQGGVGFDSEYAGAGLALRGALVRYSFEERDGAAIDDVDSALFLEPVAFVGIGPRRVRAELQFGFVVPFAGADLIDYQPIHMSLGVSARFR